MQTGLAAPQVVVVHGGQIIMHQGIAVNDFHCTGDMIQVCAGTLAACSPGGGINHYRANALAAIGQRILTGPGYGSECLGEARRSHRLVCSKPSQLTIYLFFAGQ